MASRKIGAALAATVLALLAAPLSPSAAAAASPQPFAQAATFSQLSEASSGTVAPVVKAPTTTKVTESATAVNYGNESSVQFTAEVSGGDTEGETAEVKVGSGSTSATCVAHLTGAGIGKCAIEQNNVLSASFGSYAVSAHYAGDASLEPSEGTIAAGLIITGGRTVTNVSVNPSKLTYGSESSIAVTASVVAEGNTPLPGGESAHIRLGSASCTAPLSGGTDSTGTCTIPSAPELLPGNYPASAEYAGDQNLSESKSANEASLTVEAFSPSFKILLNKSEAPVSIHYGSTATFSQSGLPAGAGGTVYFTSKSTPLCHFTLPAESFCATEATLPVDSYPEITAEFKPASPGLGYANSQSINDLSLNVETISTLFKIKINRSESATTVVYGTATTFEETGLPSDAQGTVTITSGAGGAELCSFNVPESSACTASPAAGTYGAPIATFRPSGADTYDTESRFTAAALTVERAPTSFRIAIDGSSSLTVRAGTSVTLAEAELPPGAQGTVTFRSGATTLCTATVPAATSCSTSGRLPVGSYPAITGSFADTDGNYVGSTSTGAPVTLILERLASTVTITSSPTPSTPYTTVTLTAKVAATAPAAFVPTGIVTFKSGSHTLGTGALDGSGVATLTTAAPPPGSYYASAVYGGDGDYSGAGSPTIIQTVKETFAGLFELTASYLDGAGAYGRLPEKRRTSVDGQLTEINRLLDLAGAKPSKTVLAMTIYDADITVMKNEGLLKAPQAEGLIKLANGLPAPKIVAVASLGRKLKGHAVAVGTLHPGGAELTLQQLNPPLGDTYRLIIRAHVQGQASTLLNRVLTIA